MSDLAGLSRLVEVVLASSNAGKLLEFRAILAEFSAEGALPLRLRGLAEFPRFEFPEEGLAITEAGTKKRASLHVVRGEAALAAHDRGGLEVLDATADAFRDTLRRENHTLKRALTDPRLFSGIGNAYSDEILHAARLSPTTLTRKLSDSEVTRLFESARRVLSEWTERLCASFTARFPGPGQVTAFRPEFAAHGKFGSPCPVCQSKIQRIRYADSETNYCPKCQSAGRIFADRSLSRLLNDDWPGRIESPEDT